MLAPALDVLREFLVALLDLLLALPRHAGALLLRRRRMAAFDALERDRLPGGALPAVPSASLRRIVLCCGDASGESHALRLLAALRERHPDLQVEGFGGARLEAAGMQVWEPLADLNVMGFRDVAAQLPLFFRCVYRYARALRATPADAVVLVDYPGLNRHLLRIARRLDVPVIDYIAPQLWAWAPWRVRDFRRADRLLTILPFERAWYGRRGAHATYVGHPLADGLEAAAGSETPPPSELASPGPWVALLPGSRRREIRDNLPLLLAAAAELHRRRPEVRFVLPHLRARVQPLLDELLAATDLPVVRAYGSFHGALEQVDAAWVVSGTASTEVAAHGVPSVVVYALPSRLGRWLARNALTVRWVGGANLMAGRTLAVERVGGDLDPALLASDVEALLDPGRHAAAVRELAALRRDHLAPGVAGRVAVAVEDAVAERRGSSIGS